MTQSIRLAGPARPHALLTFTGRGLSAAAAYVVRWDSNPDAIRLIWTTRSGSFSAHLRVPSDATAGSHRIRMYPISRTLARSYRLRGVIHPPIPRAARSALGLRLSVYGTPTPSPTPASGCTRLVNVDATGATDVTSSLQAFIDNSPAGSVVCFSPGGTYKVNGQLHLVNRSYLTFDGQGARLYQAVRGTSPIVLIDGGGNDLAFRNLTIEGSNPTPGLWNLTYEHNHAIQVGGAIRLDFDHVSVLNVGGDGLYLAAGTVNGTIRWADSIRFHHGLIDGVGRMGITITDGASNTVFDFNTFRRIGYYTFDIEPNGHVWNGVAAGAVNARFSDNLLGPQPYSNGGSGQPTGHLFVVTGSSGGGPADGIEVSRNTVSGRPVDIGVYNNGGLRRNIRVVNNWSDTRVGGPVMTFAGVDTLAVTGNTQPLSSSSLVSTSSCTSVTILNNLTN